MNVQKLSLVAFSCTAFALAAPLSANTEAEVGASAPEWSATDEDGKAHRLADYRGKAVVLEWTNSECPYVIRHYKADTMEKLAAELGAKEVVWLAVNSTRDNTSEQTKAWRKSEGFTYATLQDPGGELGKLYGARTTPHMFVIDTDGVLRYSGAIDDDPRGRKSGAINYVKSGVEAVFAGAEPDPSQTEPYGCGVKYK